MKAWQGVLFLPVGVMAAGVGYGLIRRAIDSLDIWGPPRSQAEGVAALPIVAPITRMAMPMQTRIAIVELFGPIHGGAKVGEYVHLLEGLRGDRKVRAVILEIDSPGGSAPASEYLYRTVSRLAREKPVIAFIRGIGASGAYMISCGATKIVALPSSIIGSIGVISINPVMKDLLKRLGIDMAVSKSGPYKDMGAFYRDATADEQKKQQKLIDQFFENFVDLVAEARSMPTKTVRKYATGEVFIGKQAKEYGLVDEIGDMEMAIDLAAQLGNVPRRVIYARPRRPLLQRFFSRFSASIVDEVSAGLERQIGGYVYYRSSSG
ncbi:MAG: signal peptide peptidase SppA [Chloroflexi bacterium]|nr:signal peptide peptidase SppA [Chloroflexota bacterium]